MTIEFIISLKIPLPIARICVAAVLLYRRGRYGYAFRKIRLNKGKYAIVDNDDFDRFGHYKWYVKKGGYTFYAQRVEYNNGKTRTMTMHREIMAAPARLIVDHINRNGLDNRRANLRFATVAENGWNSRRGINVGSSKYKGVAWEKRVKKWRVVLCYKGGRKYLGYFKDEKMAAKMYDKAAKKYHGEFAVLNNPII